MRGAIVFGGTGMDGTLMVQHLLDKGYHVTATFCTTNPTLKHENLDWVFFDLSDKHFIHNFLNIHFNIDVEEVYNFGGVSFSPDSIRLPQYTMDVNYSSVMKILEWIEYRKSKFFQASSSEVFGNIRDCIVNENTPRQPHTPYAYAKSMVDLFMRYMRENGLPMYNAISFNHECHLRSEKFVTRKITKFVANTINDKTSGKLHLGDIDSRRDWGYAPDFIEGYYNMMQGEPNEFIFASAKTHSVKDILEIAFNYVDLKWQDYVIVDKDFVRTNDRNNISGDYSKAYAHIGWKPKTNFETMITKMVQHDLK